MEAVSIIITVLMAVERENGENDAVSKKHWVNCVERETISVRRLGIV
jgi:hypothetical protein